MEFEGQSIEELAQKLKNYATKLVHSTGGLIKAIGDQKA